MAEAAQVSDSGRRLTWRAALFAALYLVAFTGFALFAAQRCTGRGLMATLTFIECAAIAGVVALFSVDLDPARLGVTSYFFRIATVCVTVVVASTVVIVFAGAMWGAGPIIGGLAAQLVILAFSLLLAGIFALVRCSGSELLFAQLVCIFVSCALLGTVFYSDPIVEAQKDPEARSVVIAAVLAANPITAISWSLLEFDLMREELMYGRLSVMGGAYGEPGHNVKYPRWWTTLGGYLAVSFAAFAGAGLIRRQRTTPGGPLKRRAAG